MRRAPAISMLLLAAALLPAGDIRAQSYADETERIGGTTYIVAFPDTTMNRVTVPNTRYMDMCLLFIYSAIENRVRITGVGCDRELAINARSFGSVDLLAADQRAPLPIATVGCVPTRAGVFRVEAASPVVLYQCMVTRYGTEAWTPLPVEAWGSEYSVAVTPAEVGADVVGTDANNPLTLPRPMPSEFLIVAAYDDTRISVEPHGDTSSDTCGIGLIVLNSGEAYLAQSQVWWSAADKGKPQPDLAGSRIYSDKPIGVISGNTRAMITDTLTGLTRNSFRNMIMEWLRPVELRGTRFVYVPTRDGREWSDQPYADQRGRRAFEHIRIFAGSADSTTVRVHSDGAEIANRTLTPGGFCDLEVPALLPATIMADRPVQTMLLTPGVAKYTYRSWPNPTFGYAAWGATMSEIIPGERWGSFAPFGAPERPSGMSHYVTVVTRAEHQNDLYLSDGTRFPLQIVPWTDFAVGTVPIAAGSAGWVEAREGATFGGRVFGTLTAGGVEEITTYSRQNARYVENLGIAYSYPLASNNQILSRGDSLNIRITRDCFLTRMEVSDMTPNAVGLRAIRLDSAVNASIARITPSPLTGALHAFAEVVPVDRGLDAHAIIVVMDRTGKTYRLPYRYTAQRLDPTPADLLDFGAVPAGDSVTENILVSNPTSAPAQVVSGSFQTRTFSIVGPAFPFTVPAGGQVVLRVQAIPDVGGASYWDTLVLKTACDSISLVAKVVSPSISLAVGDIDFGEVVARESKTLRWEICNDGESEIRLINPNGGEVIEWTDSAFSISAMELTALSGARLRGAQCVPVNVTVMSAIPGEHRAHVRVWATTRNGRDTALWSVTVKPVAGVGAKNLPKSSLTVSPNPAKDPVLFSYVVPGSCRVRLSLTDLSGNTLAVLRDEQLAPGDYRNSLSGLGCPSGIYVVVLQFGDEIQSKILILTR